jgi:hypothetical protein
MKLILWLYTRLLRLYPPNFRAEYAEEMTEVFAAAVREKQDWLGLAGLCAGELRDLPLSIIRQHLYERRRVSALIEGNTMNAETLKPIRTVRLSALGALGIFAAYGILVVFPFFALGLHNQPVEAIRGGMFDPKGFPIYSSDQISPNVLLMTSILIHITAPVWQTIWGSLLALTLYRHWGQLSSRQRWLGGIGLAASVIFMAILLSPTGRLMLTWLID